MRSNGLTGPLSPNVDIETLGGASEERLRGLANGAEPGHGMRP